jgi:hypothetical protein
MKGYRLHIAFYTPLWRRVVDLVRMLRSLVLSVALVLALASFISVRVVPLAGDVRVMMREIARQRQQVDEQEKELERLRLSGPFSQNWPPYKFVEYSRVCQTEADVIFRLLQIRKETGVRFSGLQVAPVGKDAQIFSFQLEMKGSYENLFTFLSQAEREFHFFKLKEVHWKPELKDGRYEGYLIADVRGYVQ